MVLIGITGTTGAGKGTVVHMLVETQGFVHYSARAFLIEEIERRGLPVNRDSMIVVSNELRAEHGADVVVRSLYERAQRAGVHAVIESVRTVGEVQFLHQHGALLIAVDADRAVRYERITARASETDRVTFETFCTQEDLEMHSDDPGKQSITDVMAMADIHLTNNSTRAELEQQIYVALHERGRV